MKLTEMIELANAGIKAKDVMTLHKAGYTKEMILELSEEPNPAPPDEDSKPEEKESPSDDESIDKNKEEKQEEKKEETNPALIELEKLKKQLADLQEKNRHMDQSGGVPEDPTKHIKEYIETLMIKK